MLDKWIGKKQLPWKTGTCFPCFGISELVSVLIELAMPARMLLPSLDIPFDPISADSVM